MHLDAGEHLVRRERGGVRLGGLAGGGRGRDRGGDALSGGGPVPLAYRRLRAAGAGTVVVRRGRHAAVAVVAGGRGALVRRVDAVRRHGGDVRRRGQLKRSQQDVGVACNAAAGGRNDRWTHFMTVLKM